MSRWYSSGRKRHFRRCNNEIQKRYSCPYSSCGKFYGSEGSLNLHMKIKHLAGSKTDRERLAREIVLAVREGKKFTVDQLENLSTLPPGLIQQSAKEIGFLNEFMSHQAYGQIRKRLEPYLLPNFLEMTADEIERLGIALTSQQLPLGNNTDTKSR